MVAHICALFEVFMAKQASEAIDDTLQRPYYLSRVNHDKKTVNRSKGQISESIPL
jgi:hypothetical protein